MTNREWLESLPDKEFALKVSEDGCRICRYGQDDYDGYIIGCPNDSCVDGISEWLQQEHKAPTKELTQAQLCEAFELRFGKRRAISLDEVKEVAKEIFK